MSIQTKLKMIGQNNDKLKSERLPVNPKQNVLNLQKDEP